MNKILFFILLVTYLPVQGQPLEFSVREEQELFIDNLKTVSKDSTIAHSLAAFIDTEVKRISGYIENNSNLNRLEKEKAIRSLSYLIKEMNKGLEDQKINIYEVPSTLESYYTVLTALLNGKPFFELMEPLEAKRSQLLAIAFSQYNEYSLLDDIAVYKRVSSSPQFILKFLENKPNFRFADSLLLEAAVHDPTQMFSHLNAEKPLLQDMVKNSTNNYVKEIGNLSKDKNGSELFPFVTQIVERKLTTAEILEQRKDVDGYFQFMVSNLLTGLQDGQARNSFIQPLQNGIKQRALSFYINSINELHDAPESRRFESVKNLRAEDLYYIITTGEDLYTSSYLGVYKRLMEKLKDHPADSIFQLVAYDNFHNFIRMAANYNVLSDFMHHIPGERVANLLQRYISGIESDPSLGLDRAMDIADSYGALVGDSIFSEMVQSELQSNLKRCTSTEKYFGIRLYNILLDVFQLVKREGNLDRLWTTLGNYDVLERKALENSRGEIIQLVLFYGDEDGVASFNNFMRHYNSDKKWEITRNENWVSIRSRSEKPVIIYANMPLDSRKELDLRAQDSLLAYLKQQSQEPAVLIHRGHSYHLDNTLKRLLPSVKLAILGSCGGYNKAICIAMVNPDIQIIGSKKSGSKFINDPIIEAINETLVEQQDISWQEIWTKLATAFHRDATTLSVFNEYFQPSRNVGLFVLKLFSYYKGRPITG